jgi:hypothetical protein
MLIPDKNEIEHADRMEKQKSGTYGKKSESGAHASKVGHTLFTCHLI